MIQFASQNDSRDISPPASSNPPSPLPKAAAISSAFAASSNSKAMFDLKSTIEYTKPNVTRRSTVATTIDRIVRLVTFSRAALEACCHRRSVGSGARLHTGRKPSLIGGPFFAAEQPHVSASKMRRQTDVYFQRCAWRRGGMAVKWWWWWWW